MATSDKDITIRVTVDNTGAIKVLNETESAVRNVGDGASEAGSQVEGFDSRLATLAISAIAAKVSFDSLVAVVKRAAEVQEVSQAFDSLAGGTDAAAAALSRFAAASDGMISNVELMQTANKALQAGLSTDQFEKLTAASIKLADVMGTDNTTALESLTRAFAKGSAPMLELVGVQVDLEEANKKFADSLGVSVEALSEENKVLVFRQEALKALEEKTKNLGTTSASLADNMDKAGVAAGNLFDEFAKGLANSESLNSIFGNMAIALGKVASVAATAGQSVGSLIGNILKNQQLLTGQALANSLFELGNKPFKFKTGDFGDEAAAKATKAQADAAAKAAEAAVKLREQLLRNKEAQEALTKAQEEAIKKSDEWYQIQLDGAKKIQDIIEASTEYKDILADVSSGSISTAEAADRLNLIYADTEKSTFELERAQLDLYEAMLQIGDGAGKTGDDIAKLNIKIAELKAQLKGGAEGGNSFFSSDTFASGLENSIANATGSALDSLLSGKTSLKGFTDINTQLSAGIGNAIGQSIAGPIGASIGQSLGQKAGELQAKIIDSLFGGENAGKVARDKIDTYFEDLLDAEKVFLVIDGQLQEIKDLAENEIGGLFSELDTSTADGAFLSNAFSGIGVALEEQFGVAEDISGQIGAVLYNNVGGSLNNLQILFEELGISQEDLGAAIEESWLDGQVSAEQFLATTAQINNVFTKGIPDGIGRTDLAFLNLIESAGAGRQVLDALSDLAVEAQENTEGNIQTLEDLKAELLTSGADAAKVEAAFNAIANAGITSLDQLANVSVSTGATISAELEKTGTFFTEIGENLSNIKKQMDELQDKEVNIKFNVTTSVDSNTQQYVDNPPVFGQGVS